MADIIFSKAWGTGSDVKKGRVREIRKPFCRKTKLPANWKRVRIGLMLGFTNLTDNNGAITTESLDSDASNIHRLHIGLTSKAGNPWDEGVNFVGIRSYPSKTLYLRKVPNPTSLWSLTSITDNARLDPQATIGTSGTLVGGKYGANASAYGGMADPTASTAFCFPLVIDLNVATAGTLVATYATGYSISNPTITSLNAYMAGEKFYAMANGSDPTGGWWSSDDDVACQYLYWYFPLIQNRPIIYAHEVMQLA